MKKCLHVVYLNNYFPELWEITLPLIKNYAHKTQSDLNIINQRKFPDWHIYYEKMQVYEDGKSYDYNFLVDADVLIHPEFPDVFHSASGFCIAHNDGFNASDHYHTEMLKSFQKDGRDIGVATNAVISTKESHELWKPLNCDVEFATAFLKSRSHIDEFCVSYNLAKNNFNHSGITGISDLREMFVHIGLGYGRQKTLEQALKIQKDWLTI